MYAHRAQLCQYGHVYTRKHGCVLCMLAEHSCANMATCTHLNMDVYCISWHRPSGTYTSLCNLSAPLCCRFDGQEKDSCSVAGSSLAGKVLSGLAMCSASPSESAHSLKEMENEKVLECFLAGLSLYLSIQFESPPGERPPRV